MGVAINELSESRKAVSSVARGLAPNVACRLFVIELKVAPAVREVRDLVSTYWGI